MCKCYEHLAPHDAGSNFAGCKSRRDNKHLFIDHPVGYGIATSRNMAASISLKYFKTAA
jgi:hypothetical protein